MDAVEVVLIVQRNADGKLVCRMNQPANIEKVPSTLEHCDLRSDGIRLTSLGKNRYDLRREGKTLKGNATTGTGGVFEAELSKGRGGSVSPPSWTPSNSGGSATSLAGRRSTHGNNRRSPWVDCSMC